MKHWIFTYKQVEARKSGFQNNKEFVDIEYAYLSV